MRVSVGAHGIMHILLFPFLKLFNHAMTYSLLKHGRQNRIANRKFFLVNLPLLRKSMRSQISIAELLEVI